MTDPGQGGHPSQQEPMTAGGDANTMMFVAEQALSRVSTAKVVKVTWVSEENKDGDVVEVRYVHVQPLVKQQDPVGNVDSHAEIYHLPYARLQGGDNAIINDPKVGDIGLAVFTDRDSSVVKKERKEGPPGSFRRHDLSDGFYIGGFRNDPPVQYMTFKDKGITVHDRNENTIVTNDDGIVITDTFNNVVTMDKDGIKAVDFHDNKIVTNDKGIEIHDLSNNVITTTSAGIDIEDTNTNTATMTSTGIEVRDCNDNVVTMSSVGIALTSGTLIQLNAPQIELNGFLTAGNGGGVTGVFNGDINLNGFLFATGEVTAMSSHTVSVHTHGGVSPGGANTSTPTG